MEDTQIPKSSRPIQKLAGQTVIYGLSTVIPRFINYFLVYIHTRALLPGEYGVVTEFYAYVTFLVILLTYGMETGFFRFSQNKEDREAVYGSAFISLFATSALFIVALVLFRQPIASWMGYPSNPQYILWFGLILGADAMTAIPFARLRISNRPIRFAFYKLISVLAYVLATVFFFVICPAHKDWKFISAFYRPEIGVGYVFISNLIGSCVILLLLLPEIFRFKIKFNFPLWRDMIVYSIPLMVAGLAGNIIEAIDRVVLKHLLKPEDMPMEQLGIYGANIKLAVLMFLFIQMFRYAAEPFFFNNAKAHDSRETIAEVMKIFILAGLVIFLGVTSYMDVLKHLIHIEYWGGLDVVPVLLLANLGLGIYYNLTIGFKLNNMTHLGIKIAFIGAAISIAANVIFVPMFSYYASAWAHLLSYLVMCLFTFRIAHKVYPIPYDWKGILSYIAFALILYAVATLTKTHLIYVNLLKDTILIVIFVAIALHKEQLISRFKNGQL